MEIRTVEKFIDASHQDDGKPRTVFTTSLREVDQVSRVLASITPTLDDPLIYESLQDIAEMSKFKSSIGSTNGTTSQFTEPSTDDDFLVDRKDMLDDLYDKAAKGNI